MSTMGRAVLQCVCINGKFYSRLYPALHVKVSNVIPLPFFIAASMPPRFQKHSDKHPKITELSQYNTIGIIVVNNQYFFVAQ
jgi:hypothetical protein